MGRTEYHLLNINLYMYAQVNSKSLHVTSTAAIQRWMRLAITSIEILKSRLKHLKFFPCLPGHAQLSGIFSHRMLEAVTA